MPLLLALGFRLALAILFGGDVALVELERLVIVLLGVEVHLGLNLEDEVSGIAAEGRGAVVVLLNVHICIREPIKNYLNLTVGGETRLLTQRRTGVPRRPQPGGRLGLHTGERCSAGQRRAPRLRWRCPCPFEFFLI